MEYLFYYAGVVLFSIGVFLIYRNITWRAKYEKELVSLNKLRKELMAKVEGGFIPKNEVEQTIDTFIEEFKEENIDSLIYMNMAEGIKSGALEVVFVEGVGMINEEYYQGLENDRKLLNKITKKSNEESN